MRGQKETLQTVEQEMLIIKVAM